MGSKLRFCHTRVTHACAFPGYARSGEEAGCALNSGAGRRRLDRLFDAAALQAARADVRPRGLPAEENANALEVRVEAPLRGHHRMAPVVAEARLLPANCADLRHRATSLAGDRAQPSEQIGHLERGPRGVAGAVDSRERLLARLARQQPERDRDAGLDRRELEPTCGLSRDEV